MLDRDATAHDFDVLLDLPDEKKPGWFYYHPAQEVDMFAFIEFWLRQKNNPNLRAKADGVFIKLLAKADDVWFSEFIAECFLEFLRDPAAVCARASSGEVSVGSFLYGLLYNCSLSAQRTRELLLTAAAAVKPKKPYQGCVFASICLRLFLGADAGDPVWIRADYAGVRDLWQFVGRVRQGPVAVREKDRVDAFVSKLAEK